MKPPMTLKIELAGGLRAEVGITVFDEPVFPTPCEPEVRREPMAAEWAEILGKMIRMNFTSVEVGSPPPLPMMPSLSN